MSCSTCHSAFPRLNEFGEQFAGDNMRLPNWKDTTKSGGDDMLALPATVPLAVRAQGYVQKREANTIDVINGDVIASADTDIQSPYQIKLLSSAPLSDHITYYFYAIFAEKGGNGEVVVEDAWFRHDDIFSTNIGMMLGQFQVSDLMFAREVRLTFQDFMVYRMAGLTYDRGLLFDYAAGPVDLALGWVNGNGIEENFTINSPGFQRSDHLFDNNSGKAVFGRIGGEVAGVGLGLFGYAGTQKNAAGSAGLDSGDRDTDKLSYGIDLSGKFGDKTHWFAQMLQNEWDGFLDPAVNYRWFGGFIGIDYIHSDRWAHSLLYNYTEQGIKSIKESPKRVDGVRVLAEKLGGRMGDLYLTMGAYDLVAISEFPDAEAAAKFALTLGSLGNVRTTTLQAFPEDQLRDIVSQLP